MFVAWKPNIAAKSNTTSEDASSEESDGNSSSEQANEDDVDGGGGDGMLSSYGFGDMNKDEHDHAGDDGAADESPCHAQAILVDDGRYCCSRCSLLPVQFRGEGSAFDEESGLRRISAFVKAVDQSCGC